MNKADFNIRCQVLIDEAKAIMDAKQPEYSRLSDDVLSNFKKSAENLGVSPLVIWSVFVDKQLSSIHAHIKNPDLTAAEPLQSRFADLYNYVLLGYALYKDNEESNLII